MKKVLVYGSAILGQDVIEELRVCTGTAPVVLATPEEVTVYLSSHVISPTMIVLGIVDCEELSHFVVHNELFKDQRIYVLLGDACSSRTKEIMRLHPRVLLPEACSERMRDVVRRAYGCLTKSW